MSHECAGIAFLESCRANFSDGYDPVNVTSSTLSCGSNGFLASDTALFYPAGRALSFQSSALLDDTVEGLDCSSLTLGEACFVTCAGRYTAAGDTETTLTCVFDPELQGMLLEGSTHSGKLVPCDLSTLMPPSTEGDECPNTAFGESCTANYLDGNAAISGMVAATVLTCGTDGALASDPTLPYPTCEALTCSIGDLLLNGFSSGPDCASWTTGESCAVTCTEGYHAANGTSGTLTCACMSSLPSVSGISSSGPACLSTRRSPCLCCLYGQWSESFSTQPQRNDPSKARSTLAEPCHRRCPSGFRVDPDRKSCNHHDLLDPLLRWSGPRTRRNRETRQDGQRTTPRPGKTEPTGDASRLVTSSIVPKSTPSCASVVAKTRIADTPVGVTKERVSNCDCKCRCRSSGSDGRCSQTEHRVHRGGRQILHSVHNYNMYGARKNVHAPLIPQSIPLDVLRDGKREDRQESQSTRAHAETTDQLAIKGRAILIVNFVLLFWRVLFASRAR